MSATTGAVRQTLTCAQCATEFTPGQRRGKIQIYCGPICRVAGGNARRATTRSGRANGITNPHAGDPRTGPSSSPLLNTSHTVDRAASEASDTPIDSLKALLDKAHSRVGVTAWEIALIAKRRGISPWAPLSVIIGKAH
jgi:hypothetical protein